jgi:hypothetical protein
MDKVTQEKALAALEREKARFKRQNEWTAANYERQTVTLPKGTKEKILASGEKSVNGFINRIIKEYFENQESTGA